MDPSDRYQLLTTVYRQYWPVAAWNQYQQDDTECIEESLQSNPQNVLQQKRKKSRATGLRETEWGVTKNGTVSAFSKLDKETLDKMGWSNYTSCQLVSENQIIGKDSKSKQCQNGLKTSLTKAEFKKLRDQVRDVSMEFSGTFTPASQSQKSYQVGGQAKITGKRNASHIYRSQLASSLRVFQQKVREPLIVKQPEPQVLRCRPFSSRSENRGDIRSRPTSSVTKSIQEKRLNRPQSVPLGRVSRSPTDMSLFAENGDYDRLEPTVLAQLIVKGRSQSAFGDRLESLENGEAVQNTSQNTSPRTDIASLNQSSISNGSDSSSDDEAGIGDEPEVDFNRSVPEIKLRPDQLDAIYSAPSKNDPARFDFDVDNTHFPGYAFKSPLPEVLDNLDIRTLISPKDITDNFPPELNGNKNLMDMIFRLKQIDKFQSETIESERRKKEKQKQNVTRPKSSKSPSPSLNAFKDKRCCSECLQVACVGGACCKGVSDKSGNVTYEHCMKCVPPGTEDGKTKTPLARPRSCNSCKRTHTAKYINANNVILGRPRSSHFTYCRGQNSNKPKDLRSEQNNFGKNVQDEFGKLGINCTKSFSRKVPAQPKGRCALLPGKSFFSQRKNSLTRQTVKQKHV